MEQQKFVHECCECGALLSQEYHLKRHLIRVHRISRAKTVADKLATCKMVIKEHDRERHDHESSEESSSHKEILSSKVIKDTHRKHTTPMDDDSCKYKKHASDVAERNIRSQKAQLGPSTDKSMASMLHSDRVSLKKHVCCECGARFSRKDHLKRHLANVHCMSASKILKKEGVCKIVEQEIEMEEQIKDDLDPSTDKQQSEAGKGMDKERKTSEGRLCVICKKLFEKQSVLDDHMKTDHKNQKLKYVCCDCGAQVSKKDHLKRHLIMVHHFKDMTHIQEMLSSSEVIVVNTVPEDQLDLKEKETNKNSSKMYACNVCKVAFVKKENLDKHLKDKHGLKDVLPYVAGGRCCLICKQSFMLRKYLDNHMRTVHKDQVLKFVCCICSILLSREDHVKRHLKNLHQIKSQNEIENKLASCTVMMFEKGRESEDTVGESDYQVERSTANRVEESSYENEKEPELTSESDRKVCSSSDMDESSGSSDTEIYDE